MQKKSFSTNFSSGALTMLDSMAKDLNLSRSSLLESLLISKMGNLYNPTVDEVESLNNGFLLNSLSSVTWDFRKQFSHLSSKARFELIMFFYSINLIKGISVSTNKQANISKNGDLVCYFIGRRSHSRGAGR